MSTYVQQLSVINVLERTWNAVIKLADELREKKVKIGFFSSTPQGGENVAWRFQNIC